ncbi:MAG: ATP-binding protein [Opitutaceae bacterium]
MNRFLRNLPFKHKLMALTVAISGIALLIACAAFAFNEQAAFRRTMARDFAILADMFGDNVAPGLAFSDSASIEQTLKTLSANRRIVAACAYDKQGNVAGAYRRDGLSPATGFVFPPAQPTSQRFGAERLDTFQNVKLAGEVIGVVYIGTDLDELRERAWRYAAVAGLLLAGCSLVALLLASRLQRIISQPIVDLAQTVATVTTEKNYAVRAHKQSEDELGRLIDGFNEMLAQIQARDGALQAAHDSLEQRVVERTAELKRENVERKLAEEQLGAKTAILEAQVDASIDGILVVDGGGRKIFQNQRTVELLGIPPEIAAGTDDEKQIEFVVNQTKHPTQFVEKVRYLYAHPTEICRDELELKNGTVLDRYSAPVIGKDGTNYGRIWAFRDITARKRSEAELTRVHGELLQTSRQAGMAEVATGVLHNVGNVLNSVNVSATLVTDHIRRSKAGGIAKLAAMFAEHQADLAGFLTGDDRGRKIPVYLGTLADSLAKEQTAMLTELDHLRKNIEHIKDIVAMQQSFARNAGFIENVALTDLVEDALRMNASSLVRHDVQLVREFEIRPSISTDKHKIVQILINLVRNAKHACDDSRRPDKRIVVRIAGDAQWVRISVGDNGVGIPPENLVRIFNHGFTTKKDGHGFGLHSGALAAKELGGALSVQSEGPGLGATFTLELPRDKPPVADGAEPGGKA